MKTKIRKAIGFILIIILVVLILTFLNWKFGVASSGYFTKH
jgi:hypothetical protein